LECLLLQHGLTLPHCQELQAKNEFRDILQQREFSDDPEWAKLRDSSYWTEENSKKFIWAWQSIRAIRAYLHSILPPGGLAGNKPEAFYLALLQASLPMIYYEDNRFYNAKLQKLYLTLASGLLCERL
jgi:hypothetical protein